MAQKYMKSSAGTTNGSRTDRRNCGMNALFTRCRMRRNARVATWKNKIKQRSNGKLLGGITGKGFLPGQSGNPNGRPPTRGLLEALRSSVSKLAPDGRRVEDALVDALIAEAFHGRNKLAALSYIFDRLEGRPRQQ